MKSQWMAVWVLGLAACGGAAQKAPETAAQHAHGEHGHEHGEHADKASCPMQVEGVSVAYEDTADGAAMVFTTASGDAVDLQQRVAQKAERHNAPTPKHEPNHIPHSARADNVERGARLVMVPADPKDLEALRAHVKEHVDHMQKEGCPMEHGHGHSHEGGHDHHHEGGHDHHHEAGG